MEKKRSLDENIVSLLNTAKEEVVLKKRAVEMIEESEKNRENGLIPCKECSKFNNL